MRVNHHIVFGLLVVGAISCRTPNSMETAEKPNSSEPTGEIGDGQTALHSWGNYHWAHNQSQFTLKIGDNLTTAAWKDLLRKASADWNNPTAFGATSTPILTNVIPGTSGSKCRMVPGTTQVCNGKYGRNGWLGLASINISGDHITQGSAKMNDTYFSMSTYNNPNERRHVICQELAHTYGLDHQSEDGSSQNSCMDYFSNTGANATSTQSTTPNAHDFEQLNSIYAHLDPTTTVAPALASAASDVTDDPKSWGELKRQSKDGHGSTYQRKNRDGSITLTHVFWTSEHVKKCPACDHRD